MGTIISKLSDISIIKYKIKLFLQNYTTTMQSTTKFTVYGEKINNINTEVNSQSTLLDTIYNTLSTKTGAHNTYNGTFWEKITSSSKFNCVYYAPSGIILLGGDGSGIKYYKGTTVTNTNITSGTVYSFAFLNNVYFACTSAGLYYSTNYTTWTLSKLTKASYKIYYEKGTYLVSEFTGISYATNYTSTWTESVSGDFYNMIFADGTWITNDGSTSRMYYSADGKSWTAMSDSIKVLSTANYECNEGHCVVASYSGIIYNYTNLSNASYWESESSSQFINGEMQDLCYGNGLLVSSDKNAVYYCTDSIGWSQSDLSGVRINKIVYANNIWLAGGLTSIYFSPNGKNWYQSMIATNYGAKDICYCGDKWIAVDNNGSLIKSDIRC